VKTPAPRPAAEPKSSAHRAATVTKPAPTVAAKPTEPKATAKPPAANARGGIGIPIAPSAMATPPAAPAPAAAEADKSGRASKKPKPPAKTMQVPAPLTDFLLKQAIPDVRRIASAALLSDNARGITPPGAQPRHKEPERTNEPRVDATLIASSLASDVHPKIEDNYDYSVLDEFAGSPWCPQPTRMINTGCGGGEAAVYFAKRGFNVVGIDSDRMAVGLARERAWLGGVEIDFMVGEQFETPNLLPAESFGLAVDRGAFYRLTDDRDRQRYLSNIRRLLFQGGVCFLSAGFFPLPEGYEKPKSKKGPPKVLLVREGGVVVNEVRQAGFDPVHRVLRPTADSGEYGELLLTLKK
jgi:SAM-dependent methyltransferase